MLVLMKDAQLQSETRYFSHPSLRDRCPVTFLKNTDGWSALQVSPQQFLQQQLKGLIGNLFLFQFVLQYPAMGPRLKKFQRRHFMLECICTCIMFINVQVRVRVWVRFKG